MNLAALAEASVLVTIAASATPVRAAHRIGLPNRRPSQARVRTWARWEAAVTSEREYDDPVRGVTVRAIYTGPGGRTIHGFAFWDGGKTYRIRCAFPVPGLWRWRTECSDKANRGLNGQAGEVRVTSYRGSNPLYRHGFLRVSDNGRYLCHADATPFLWIGDTAWAGPLRATDAEWQEYLMNRARKRFSIVQVALAPWWAGEKDAAGNRPFEGDGISRPNPAFWQAYERKIQAANEKGLAAMIVGVMEPTTRYPKEAEARVFARYLAARLFGDFVAYSASFDSPYMPLGDVVGESLREATALHLIPQHPGTPSGKPTNIWSEEYRDQPYLSFAGDQSGHNGGNRELCARQAIQWNLSLWRRQPPKPVVNLEAMYDAHGVDAWTAVDARSLGWRSWLSGAVGYTYGAGDVPPKVPGMAGGIWHWVSDPAAPDYWRKAMDWPSSGQMTIMRVLLASIPWWRLEPAHELIRNQPAEDTRKMVLARTADRSLAVAYLPDNDRIDVDLSTMRGSVTARWFDPVRNRYQAIPNRIPGASVHEFIPPARGEWVLLLRSGRGSRQ